MSTIGGGVSSKLLIISLLFSIVHASLGLFLLYFCCWTRIDDYLGKILNFIVQRNIGQFRLYKTFILTLRISKLTSLAYLSNDSTEFLFEKKHSRITLLKKKIFNFMCLLIVFALVFFFRILSSSFINMWCLQFE